MSTAVQEKPDIYERFFGVVAQERSYLNIVYLLLSFPLGLLYFIFLIVGLSVGIGLVIIWVGIPILLAVLAGWWGMLLFEREMANRLLRVDIPSLAREPNPPDGMWARIKTTLSNPVTWKGLVYLFARFPLGILAFVVVVTWLSLTLGLISAPFVYSSFTIEGRVGTMNEALLCAVVGIAIGFAGMHLMNFLAYIFGQFAVLMLGKSQPAAAAANVPAESPPQEAVKPIEAEAAPETKKPKRRKASTSQAKKSDAQKDKPS
jgi:hypothetical protein